MKREYVLLPIILALLVGIFPSLALSQEAGLRSNPVGDGAAQNLLSRIESLGDIPINKVTVEMSFTQPLDHQNPEAGTFDQRVVLIHKGFEKPLVLWLEGYAWKDKGEQEITRLLAANQLSVEHRYFGDSKPGSEKWRYLTIEQAAADHHRIVQAFKRIYTGKWVNSGISKGGQTTMYHRRFYPDDVDASVCYVSPLNFSDEDPRFADFLESVGDETRRKKVVEFQKLVLEKKEQLLPLFNEYSAEKEFTYKIGTEAAFEYCALEYSFSYWQWNKRIKSEIPTESASIQEIFDHFIVAVDPYYYSDKGVSDLTPFFHQALNQIGFYSYDTSPFDGLLTAAREPTFRFCAPEGTEPVFDPIIMGENLFNINRIMAKIDAKIARITCVKEGIDLALHDLKGKLLKTPVYNLLGGSFRGKIPVASEIGIDTPEAMAENALAVLELGIRVIKIKGSDDARLDVERIKTVRQAVGSEIELRLDPNAAWTTIGTIKTMKKIEDCNLQLLEQPIPSWDLKGMSHIRNNIGIPLMADESIWTPQDVIKIAEYGAADIINIKIAKSCGLALAKQIEFVAESQGLPCIVGTEIEPGFSLVAKLHLAASMKIHPLASEFTELSLLKGNILKHKFEIREGCVKVPDGPGFGVELDEQYFEKVIIKEIN